MPTKSEAFDAVAANYTDHYDIVSAVMFKHVPVVTGIIGMILVLTAGLAWDWWYKRSLRGRTDLSVPAPLDDHPDVINARKEAEVEAEVEAALAAFAERLDEAGTDVDRLVSLADGIDSLPYRDVRARGAFLLAQRLDRADAPDKAERFYLMTIELGKREAQEVAAQSARWLADYYAGADQKGEALTFARKALLLFEGAGLDDGVEEATSFIRTLRA